MSQTDPIHNMTRRVENGYEIVSIYYHKDWLYLLKIISSSDKEAYKGALAELCGYPVEEWTRIKEVLPHRQENGDYLVEVWFRNPGKQFEQFLAKSMMMQGTYSLKVNEEGLELRKDNIDWGVVLNISTDALSYTGG